MSFTNDELVEASKKDWLTKAELTSAINSLMFPRKWDDDKAMNLVKEKVESQKAKRIELQKEGKLKPQEIDAFFDGNLEVSEESIEEKEIVKVDDLKVNHLTEEELMASDKDVLRVLADELAGSNDELEKADEDATKEDLTKYILINAK